MDEVQKTIDKKLSNVLLMPKRKKTLDASLMLNRTGMGIQTRYRHSLKRGGMFLEADLQKKFGVKGRKSLDPSAQAGFQVEW